MFVVVSMWGCVLCVVVGFVIVFVVVWCGCVWDYVFVIVCFWLYLWL